MTKPPLSRSPRILVIGSLPPPIGGTTTALYELVGYLSSIGISVRSLNTSKSASRPSWLKLPWLIKLVVEIRANEIVTLHTSDRATTTAAPFIWLLCRALRRPFVLRQFGGSLHDTYSKLNPLHQWLIRNTVLRSDILFLETKRLVSLFSQIEKCNPRWFPNSRLRSPNRYKAEFANGRRAIMKCLYVGRISRAKGVLIGAEAISKLTGTDFTACGPLEDISKSELQRASVNYLGTIDASQVPKLMSNYDLLLLPTRHEGEGYPGVLIEAAHVGLPVIVSPWSSIPEMFSAHEVTYANPESTDEIIDALQEFLQQPELLKQMSARILCKAADFDASNVFEDFIWQCRQLTSR